MNFNQLSEPELERLALLSEEMGEVIQVIGKIVRHGYESTHPESTITNRKLLEIEVGDVLAALNLMYNAQDLDYLILHKHRESKLHRVKQYLHHQG